MRFIEGEEVLLFLFLVRVLLLLPLWILLDLLGVVVDAADDWAGPLRGVVKESTRVRGGVAADIGGRGLWKEEGGASEERKRDVERGVLAVLCVVEGDLKFGFRIGADIEGIVDFEFELVVELARGNA